MAPLTKLFLFAVTILMPGGILIPLMYWALRRRRPDQHLDFTERSRRVPPTRARQDRLMLAPSVRWR